MATPARTVSLIAATVALTGCGAQDAPVITMASIGASESTLQVPMCQISTDVLVDTIAGDFDTPWDVAFLGDGTALVTERSGVIRAIDPDAGLRPEPWALLDVAAPEGSEIGLMGIDVDPSGSWVYLAATEEAPPSLPLRLVRRVLRIIDPERGQPYTLSVHRIAVGESPPRRLESVVRGVAAGYLHGGGALRFGPDGLLYLSNGDAADHWRAQMEGSLRGKILRYSAEGRPAEGNPHSGSPVFASGIRHVQGMAWLDSGEMLVIDHGPSGLDSEGGRTDHDELNLVEPGSNLGWPVVAGPSRGGDLTSPIVDWTPALAPAGLATWSAPGSAWHGDAFVTGLRGTRLERIELHRDADGVAAVCRDVVLGDEHGRLRLVRQAPDGSLWVGTSNRDGRGLPREGGDYLLRVTPVADASPTGSGRSPRPSDR